MAVNAVSVQNSVRFNPNIILLTLCFIPSGNPIKCREEFLSIHPISSDLNVLTFSPPDWVDALLY